VVEKVSVRLISKTFQSGCIRSTLVSREKEMDVEGETFESASFEGSKELLLRIVLSRGNGDVAWQHAQVFRQALTSKDCTLEVTVSLKSV